MFEETEEQENEPRREPQGRQRSFVGEIREGVKRQKSAAQKFQRTVKTTVTVAKAMNPLTLGILAAAVIILLFAIFIMFGFVSLKSVGGGLKVDNESGGSIFSGLSFDNPEHKELVEHVVQCAQGEDPILVSDALDLSRELDWSETEKGDKYHNLDYRVVTTLSYLCDTWSRRGQGKIGINLLASDGPMATRTGVKKDSGEFEMIDSYSAYDYGQAIGVNVVGLTSPGLTRALGLREPIPVRVDWQRVTSEASIRLLYEQIGVDAARLYNLMNVAFAEVSTVRPTDEFWQNLANAHRAVVEFGEKDIFSLTLERAQMLIDGLNKLSGVAELDKRTGKLIGLALERLDTRLNTLVGLEQGNEVAFMKEMAKKETEEDFRKGIQYSFRAMQVANMVGWYGNTDKIALWKAYEARQNIRQLMLDLLRMPVELADEKDADKFDSFLAVRQLIIYSPEDDLDNNLPDLDIFPKGMVAVNEGGVTFDATKNDGKLMLADTHFASLPIDNGPFSKACTTFVYKVKEDDQEKIGSIRNLLSSLAPSGPIEQMCRLLYGPIEAPVEVSATEDEEGEDIEIETDEEEEPEGPQEIEIIGRVTYQKFVHIAF